MASHTANRALDSRLWSELQREYDAIKQQFTVDTAKLKEISSIFQEELKEGLEKEGANISMNVTWVQGFPTGKERGQFLTIDLGGTNLRVCWITLKGADAEIAIQQHMYELPDEVKTGRAEELWSMVADSLKNFVDEHSLGRDGKVLPLGFTFSYPVLQESLDHGKLVTWTKGFDIKGVEGKNVAAQLRDAMVTRNLPVKLVALVNDTVGAMIASAYHDPKTIIGAIFGTGCNAAYMEKVGSIAKLQNMDAALPPDLPMAINCEYGAFDNLYRVLPRTKYDTIIDRESPRPGEQSFEKMSAGLYLGEIFRLILLDLHERGLVFRDASADSEGFLRQPYRLDTAFLSSMENDSVDQARRRYQEALSLAPTSDELDLSRLLAETIAIRGARLCACGVAAICRTTGTESGHVAADGSVANKHPKFKARWSQALGEILNWPEGIPEEERPIIITSAEDGSGVGAAVIVAMALGELQG